MASSAASFSLLTFLVLFSLFPSRTISGPIAISSIIPNFTASYYHFIDSSGTFLSSTNNSFQARISNPIPQSTSFYFVVVHVSSNTIVWSANRNRPISQSSELRFTPDGLGLYNDTGHLIWSTPENPSSVSSVQLMESGNLVLIDAKNNTFWQTFDFPTDVLVVGQKLPVGKSLVASVQDEDLSEGGYRLVVGHSDAMLQWNGMNYWKLSMEKKSFPDKNFPVEYMMMNSTGVYLIGDNGSKTVIKLVLHESNDVRTESQNFHIVKLDDNGVISVVSFNPSDGSSSLDFAAPADTCRIPYICRRLGLCTNGGSCQCASAFHSDPKVSNGDCVPSDGSLSLPGPCNGSVSLSDGGDSIKYLNLRSDLDYFWNDFTDPAMRGVNLSVCQNLCSRNCSCMGVFYGQGSGSCYVIMSYLGSFVIKSSSTDRLGYIKVGASYNLENKKSDFPVIAVVLLPPSGIIVISIVAVLVWLKRRRRRRRKMWEKRANSKLESYSSSGDEEMNFVAIPGLPVRFDYKELAWATAGFGNQIGSGGFGTVYKGTLNDGSDIAVKKITCLGPHGKREFLTEIAVIGKVHHVNLVKLKGFCAQRGQRLLVYEYMKRGSLDRTLFRGDPVLEWSERYEIALGTARGLAYLHSGCEHKIIHCDVKPENILLHERPQVKISDFGLSKLLSPEQSGLFTTMRGTRGYLAPEWLTSSTVSDKTDVYSYGMVLLEILSGRKNSSPQVQNNNSSSTTHASDSSTSGESGQRLVYFPLFALEMHEHGRYLDLVDPRLAGRVADQEVEKLVRVALCCVQEEPNLRPSMTNVVGMLEGRVPLDEPRLESLNFLRFYGRRFTEESRMEENNRGNIGDGEIVMCRQLQLQGTNTSDSSHNSLSYMSSQQVSGPR